MKAVVVGGGVAGPATAMALQQVGIEAVVLEARHRTATEAGSYLTIAPNGLDALSVIGCLDLVRDLGFPSRRSTMLGATGRRLGSVTLGTPLADGTPALTMKRPHLSRALMDEAARRGIEVRYAAKVSSVATEGSRAVAVLDDGGTVEGDLLVGASGVRSLVRSAIDPDAPAARYVGLTNFGGFTRATPLARELPADGWRFVFGRHAFVGLHRTPADDVVWFVNVPEPEISRERRAATSLAEWRARLAALVADDTGPAGELIETGELELAGDNTYDLGHVSSWHRGRLLVVGDAAHAPSPSSGQGVSLALEDAVVLAGSLASVGEVTPAFDAFVEARRARVEKVVAVGARSSSSKLPGRVGRVPMEAMLRVVFRYLVTDRAQDWITGYRVSATPEGRAVTATSGAPAPGRPRRR
ncbi:2-polyprenyl-6-methoxyphenol hydroxylase [Pedococcus dokdonensis]|uniref:2-polyprenyl-6-methoxyphenol hydroxylase n=1 Tax=Pedococcus dokdonensis TaxID=443156 RepID=A0A1H0TS64_9MICO|nr:NAD(P)/FAD-dependent oxidoreductase [Pedococcus dokdonensis]SDP56701.1 2-polyprenyl-6-methoxyphenol hydroxylase [Pedococcus dokdonensis]